MLYFEYLIKNSNLFSRIIKIDENLYHEFSVFKLKIIVNHTLYDFLNHQQINKIKFKKTT